jgi:hypothetical protein
MTQVSVFPVVLAPCALEYDVMQQKLTKDLTRCALSVPDFEELQEWRFSGASHWRQADLLSADIQVCGISQA